MGSPSGPSLRERSKAKRREAIRRSAMRLFAERGYAATTIVGIAEAAEVAPRTVTMYFPTKADIAMSVANETGERLTAALCAHAGDGLVEAIGRWLSEEAEHLDAELLALGAAMFEANPDLRALGATGITEALAAARAALLAETGLAPDSPMSAILEAAVSAAIGQYITVSLPGDKDGELRERLLRLLRGMFDAVG